MTNTTSRAAVGAISCLAIVAGCLAFASEADAAEISTLPSRLAQPAEANQLTRAPMDEAVAEAREAGLISREAIDVLGTRSVTFDLGGGFTFDLVDPATRAARLGAGADSYGAYVSFNGTDQGMILNGASFGIGLGLCAISAGTFCAVAGAVLTVATLAVTQNGGLRCGTKSLRVYPFSGHKPRCA